MNLLKSVQEISLDETFPLRSSVLCNDAPFEQCRFNHDGKVEALHYGLKDKDLLIGIVSCYKHSLEAARLTADLEYLASTEGCQFRGMAVQKTLQNLGFGKTLLQAAERMMAEKWSPHYGWLYSLPESKGFYEKLGFTTIGEFEMVNVGPLVTMYRTLEA